MVEASRRQVLQLGVAAAVSTAVPLGAASQVLAAQSTRLSRSTFTPLVGATFSMVTTSSSYPAVLRSVDDLPFSRAGDRYRFRLLFEVTSGPEQGTYLLRHRTLAQQLFVVPVGAAGNRYEAVVYS